MSETIKPNYTRVTTPLSKYNDFSSVDPLVLHKACERGTKVHRYCELHMLDEYFPEPDKELAGYVESFKKWYDTMVSELISTEERYYDTKLKITGAIDIVAVLKGDRHPTIIDIKTPALAGKTWRLQLAAYKHLYNIQESSSIPAERCLSLRVDKEGKKAKINEYTSDYDLNIYLYMAALKLHRYFNGL